MTQEELLGRVAADPDVCGGQPCIRGTRIYIAIILDSLAEFVRGQYALDFEAGSTISEGDKIKIKCLRHHVTLVTPENY